MLWASSVAGLAKLRAVDGESSDALSTRATQLERSETLSETEDLNDDASYATTVDEDEASSEETQLEGHHFEAAEPFRTSKAREARVRMAWVSQRVRELDGELAIAREARRRLCRSAH